MLISDNTFILTYYFTTCIKDLEWSGHLLIDSNNNQKYKFIYDGIVYSSNKNIFNNNIYYVDNLPKGEYTCYYYNNDICIVFQDPLGSDHIYYYKDENYFICSNDYYTLLIKLHSLDIHLSFDYSILVCSIFLGDPFCYGTGIKEIKLLDPWYYIYIDRISKSVKLLSNNFFSLIYDILDYKVDYSSILSYVIKRLKQHAEFISEIKIKKIIDITGGADSRVVLATFLSNGFIDFSAYTFGAVDSYDMNFSNFICNLLDINKVLIKRELGVMDSTYSKYKYLNGIFKTNDLSFYSSTRHKDAIIITGSYGELCRSYYAKHVFSKYLYNIEHYNNFSNDQLIKEKIKMQDRYGLLNKDCIDLHTRRANEYLKDLPGQKHNMLLDHYYNFIRSRIHFGMNLKLRRKCFYPSFTLLNDYWFYILSYAVSFQERVNDKNIQSLLYELYPPFVFINYDKPPYYNDKNFKHYKSINLLHIRNNIKFQNNLLNINNDNIDIQSINKDVNYFKYVKEEFYNFIYDNNIIQFINIDNIHKYILNQDNIENYKKFFPLIYWYNQIKSILK